MDPTSARDNSYWYENDQQIIPMLQALRAFRRADQDMRARMSAAMKMNITDMQALQFVIAAHQRGELATPRGLATDLGISTASTTKLLDRLSTSGHLTRTPHPHDRRSVILTATEHAHREVHERLAQMHERMATVAHRVPPQARMAVEQFLRSMAEELDRQGEIEPLRPDPRLR